MGRIAGGESGVTRIARILRAFGAEHRELTDAEIARRSGLHVATASRHAESAERSDLKSVSTIEKDYGVRIHPPQETGQSSPTTGRGGSGMARRNVAYLLCGDRWEAYSYRIGVLREADGRGGSAYVYDALTTGDLVAVGGPRNNFALVPSPRQYWPFSEYSRSLFESALSP